MKSQSHLFTPTDLPDKLRSNPGSGLLALCPRIKSLLHSLLALSFLICKMGITYSMYFFGDDEARELAGITSCLVQCLAEFACHQWQVLHVPIRWVHIVTFSPLSQVLCLLAMNVKTVMSAMPLGCMGAEGWFLGGRNKRWDDVMGAEREDPISTQNFWNWVNRKLRMCLGAWWVINQPGAKKSVQGCPWWSSD